MRVVALEQAVAAPLCSRHLAELGADVVKVERPPDGDFARRYDTDVHGLSGHFVWLNAGKRSLALDARAPGGAEVLGRLLAGADVLLANLGPGALDRLAGDLDERLIVVTISGYGAGGPYERRKAFDLLVQGEAGVTRHTGTPDQPAKPGVSLADLAAGVYALQSVTTALFARERTGRGARVDVSMLDVVTEWMSPLLLAQRYAGAAPPPAGTRHATICPYGPFGTADGRTLNIAVQNEGQWRRLCGVLGAAELADDPRFATNSARVLDRDLVEAAIERRTSTLPAADLTRALDAADVPWGDLNAAADVLAHPQLAARQRWRTVTLPGGGEVETLLAPFLQPGPGVPHVPAFGEHTDAVLAELGYDAGDVAALRAAGTVG